MLSRPVPKVLIVDDEPMVRDFLARAVTGVARDVGTASSANQALNRMAGEEFDLIISDLSMADGDGIDLLTAIRQSCGDLAFILVSGCASLTQAIKAMRLQASDFLVKPF